MLLAIDTQRGVRRDIVNKWKVNPNILPSRELQIVVRVSRSNAKQVDKFSHVFHDENRRQNRCSD